MYYIPSGTATVLRVFHTENSAKALTGRVYYIANPALKSMVCKFCDDNESNRAYRKAGFGFNLDWLIENCCDCHA